MNLFEIDELQLYFGDDYVINDKIVLRQPTIDDIIKYGEKKYFSMVHTLTAIPSDMKAQLFDAGVDYEQISDFELFVMLSPTLSQDKTAIIFKDLDFSKFKPYPHPENGELILVDKEAGIIIDRLIYERIVNYLRKVHGLKKKVEYAANEFTKRILIEEDRRQMAMNSTKPYKSFLTPIISSVKVRMGYTTDYIRHMGVVELMDDVGRLQIIHNADALLQGVYAGTIDGKKLNKSELNWMRDLSKD